jgi:iron complex transport system substrate-binding protein
MIAELNPDLIFTFSDVQANLTKKLIQAGYNVVANNQHSIREILNAMLLVGNIVGRNKEVTKLIASIEKKMEGVRSKTAKSKNRPKFF